ncbi:acyltransferase family protein [Dyadobacter diqingensis]|uniref:acyltransferase family protein n=1 Tax=Dyadobacter diqingensis TaxID=2938121 RepID=UPI0020C194AE|nr:acyltransferase family protein [Dyadobacter diqingensis]
MKNRVAYIDHLKGISILLVVVGHFIQYNTIESKDSRLFSFIYSFHMPLFMFISGYVAYLSINERIFQNYSSFLLKKIRSLLVPFFAWPLLVDKLFFNGNFQFNPYPRFLELMEDPRTGLWFLWYLFFLTIIYSAFLLISNHLRGKFKFVTDVCLFFTFLIFLVILKVVHVTDYVDSFIQYYGYFFIGIFIAKYTWLKEKILDYRLFSFFLILFVLVVGFYSFGDPNFHSMGISLLIKIVSAVSAILSSYFIINKITFNAIVDGCVTKWGMSSIVIYATHFKFIDLFKGLYLIPELNNSLIIFISLFFSVLIISLCMGIYEIVKLCPPLNLLLYGGKTKV